MDNQEAIEIIKSAQAQIEWDCPMDYATAFDMAISALEKQIPVKATFDSDMDYVECSVCCQLTNANGFPEDINYCYHCGQAFDWEESK